VEFGYYSLLFTIYIFHVNIFLEQVRHILVEPLMKWRFWSTVSNVYLYKLSTITRKCKSIQNYKLILLDCPFRAKAVPVAVRYKPSVCNHTMAGIAVSNLSEGLDVRS
jgi:hypothetical protein